MYNNLRVGDRVASITTGRTGVITNLTASPGWEDQAEVEWDDGIQDERLSDWPTTASLVSS